MATLILTDQLDSTVVISRRPRAGERLVTRVRGWNLDIAIAGGACPDSSGALSLRANELISWRTRRRLASTILTLLHDASSPPAPRHENVPVCWQKVAHARAPLQELVDRLLSRGPVAARGVAQVRLLLRAATSPLYSGSHVDDLAQSLQAAIDALQLRP
jgi:hypothetical protein